MENLKIDKNLLGFCMQLTKSVFWQSRLIFSTSTNILTDQELSTSTGNWVLLGRVRAASAHGSQLTFAIYRYILYAIYSAYFVGQANKACRMSSCAHLESVASCHIRLGQSMRRTTTPYFIPISFSHLKRRSLRPLRVSPLPTRTTRITKWVAMRDQFHPKSQYWLVLLPLQYYPSASNRILGSRRFFVLTHVRRRWFLWRQVITGGYWDKCVPHTTVCSTAGRS